MTIERRTRFLGRRIKPVALSLSIAASVEAMTLLPFFSWHDEYHGPDQTWLSDLIEHGVGVLAIAVTVAFWLSWWRNCAKCLDRALSGSTILWLWVSIVGILQGAPLGRTLLAFAWAVLSAGSAWLETGEEER